MSNTQKPMAGQERKKDTIGSNATDQPETALHSAAMNKTLASGRSHLQSVNASRQEQQEAARDLRHGKAVDDTSDMFLAATDDASTSNGDPCHRLVELEQMRLAASKAHAEQKESLRRKYEMANRALEENNRIKILRLNEMRAEADRMRARITLAQVQCDRNTSENAEAKAALQRISNATVEAKSEIKRLKMRKEELSNLLSERQKILDDLKHEKSRAQERRKQRT
ncbi:hypothetical protein BX666DRAFT_2031485 [Dichotomocladium elegans]|nr:hypothetical protein BX666DRAFT_2031485 [Dichotomocladium elegans]